MPQEFSRVYDSGGGSRDIPVSSGSTRIDVIRFPGWPSGFGYLLASLVASSTASRTSNIVTITATAHGITTGTSFVGYRFYYPGSPSLAAGWYDSILTIPDANTITFSATGTDFGSESINGGAAWTTLTSIILTTIPGGTLKDGSKLSLKFMRSGDGTATIKTLSAYFGGTLFGTITPTTTANMIGGMGLHMVGTGKQYGISGAGEFASSTVLISLTKSILVDQEVSLRGQLSAASAYIAILGTFVEITQ